MSSADRLAQPRAPASPVTTVVAPGETGTRPPPSSRAVAALLVPVAAAFVIRIPGIVEPFGPDQGVYATIAWGLQQGLALYRDLWEQKPPGIYLTYFFGFLAFGTRPASVFWLEYLSAALATVLLFDIGRRLLGVRFGALTAAVFAIATLPAARHAYGGFLERAVTETFISPLAVAAAWATVIAVTRQRDRWAFAAGLFVGIASVYKQTALIYWPMVLAWTWFASDFARTRRLALLSGAGVLVAPVLTLVWLWSQGLLLDAWIAVVQYPVAYLGLGGEGVWGTLDRFAHEVWRRMKTDEVWALGTLSGAAALLAWRQWRTTRQGLVACLGAVWFTAALIAIVANGPRLFMTYFVPSLVPISLLVAWLLDRTLGRPHRWRLAGGLLLAGLTVFMLIRSGSIERGVSMTAWDARHLAGLTSRDEYLQRFRSRSGRAFSAADNERLAEYVRTHTRPGDRIFVFGMTASAYFSSGRLPASRFSWVYPAVSNMIDRPEFRVETLAAELSANAPTYIILQRGNGDSFSGWRVEDAFAEPPIVELLQEYVQETEIGNFVLYRRRVTQADRPVTLP